MQITPYKCEIKHLLGPNILQFSISIIILCQLSPRMLSKNTLLFRQLVNASRQASFKHLTPGSRSAVTISKLEFIEPLKTPQVPTFRLLHPDGTLVGDLDSSLNDDKILELYNGMITLNTMDKIMFDSQRQGRISFYMTSFGEEALQFGSGSGLNPEDWIYAQYRESGLLLYRKMALKLMMAQCYGNKEDLGKGRQMPIHYGNRSLNFVTISSTLSTQMPQAVGTAYSFKLDKSNRIVACYFGEGASSEGDAHAAMNFASTLDCPVIFFCRNNGYAISTPTDEQFRSDGIVWRGLGYGMSAIRVDGNDLFAVHTATKAARDICLKESRPVLIEAMSYRVGHHSTSDDSSAYRSVEEIKEWEKNDNPINRVNNYLTSKGLWSETKEKEARKEIRAQVIEAFSWAEKLKKLPISTMFEDVYKDLPSHLVKQRNELKDHLDVFGSNYPVNDHEGF